MIAFASVPVDLDWIPYEHGGRRSPPIGPVYATTAHFEDEPISEAFSVVFRASDDGFGHGGVGWIMSLLAPEKLADKVARLERGATLIVLEGPRPVATCTVLSPVSA